MKRLRLIGLSHHTAPVAARELLAMALPEATDAQRAICLALGTGSEAVLLSTCNRVELYWASDVEEIDGPDPLDVICRLRGIDAGALKGLTYRLAGREAVAHLFRVAASLDSLVPGEQQIAGQVRRAYESARRAGTAGPMLHGLFQRALAVGKEVMSTTRLSAGRQSVASVAVQHLDQALGQLEDKTILCVGAGQMARLVLEQLAGRAVGRVIVCNRDLARAESLARPHGARVCPFSMLDELLAEADAVIATTGSREPVITAHRLRPVLAGRGRPLLLVDIAVPRDVEPAVSELDHVQLCDIDALESAVSQTLASSREALQAAERIVAWHVGGFLEWHRQRAVAPTIRKLYQGSRELAAAEAARTLRKLPELDEEGRRHVEAMALRIVNKLLHGPVSTLRSAAAHAHHGPVYQHAVEKLFSLEQRSPEHRED